jgi:L,D-transpeptidase catalytic domain
MQNFKIKQKSLYFTLGGLIVVLIVELLVVISIQIGLFDQPFELPWTKIESGVESESEEETPAPYLRDEEVVVLTNETIVPIEEVLFEYVVVKDSCDIHFVGECVRVRSGPGIEYPVVYRLRDDVVLKVDGKVERDGVVWYKIVFDEWLRYPERVTGDWYVAADFLEVLLDEGDKTTWDNAVAKSNNQKIIIDRSEQKLFAYDGDELFMETSISTGLELTPTPRGTFTVFKKTPSRYMQGPLPDLSSQDYYDLPGVPWNLYFTEGGAVIHGAYWHSSFGTPYSHGCVNMVPTEARTLYSWADLGTVVIVRD